MSKQQWTPPSTDTPVSDSGQWQPPSTDTELPKKAGGAGSPLTSPSLPNGLANFQDSLTRTEATTPLSPQGHEQKAQHDKELSEARQKHIDEANDKFRESLKKLSPEERNTIVKVNETAAGKPNDELREPGQDELKHQEFMENHHVVRALNYMGSQATHGAVQVLKGASHEWNKALGSPAAEIGNDILFGKLDQAADLNLTKTDIAKSEENKPTAAAGMLANFAPAVAGGAALDAPKAMMFLQGVGQGKELADKLDLNPTAKEALIQGSGAVNLLLDDIGGEYLGKIPSKVKGDLVTGAAAEAIKESAGKKLTADSFRELLANKAATVAQKMEKAPLATLEHYTNVAKTLGKIDIANFALHKTVDALNDKPVFNETTGDLVANLNKSVTQDAPMLAAVPMAAELTKLTPLSGYKNEVIQHLVEKPDDAEAVKSQLRDHAESNGWTPEETQATMAHVDKIAQASKSLPDIAPEKKAKGIELVIGRNDLQSKLADIQEQKKTLDPAVADLPSKPEEYLTDKIDQANDKLRTLVTGKRTTYSNPEEGVYLKTTDGKAEKITENRYKLENLERTSKQQQNENNESAQKGQQEEGKTGNEEKGISTEEKESNVSNGAENAPTFTNKDISNDDKNEPQDEKIAKVKSNFKEGDPVEFKADGKVIKGTWENDRVRDEKGNQWGLLSILSDKDGYIKNLKEDQSPVNFFKLGEQDEFYHASPTKRVGPLREGEAPQFGKGTYFSTNKDLVINEFGKELTKVNLSIEKPLYTGTKEEDAVGKLAAKNWNKENLTYDKEDEVWRDKNGKETMPVDEGDLGERLPVKYFSDAAKQLGYDAIIDKNSHTYDNEIVVLDPNKIHYKDETATNQETGASKGEASNKDNAETGKQSGSERVVSAESEDAKLPEKQRFKIKGDVVTPLPPAEHTEANELLTELLGITIKDIEDEQQERNESSEGTAPALPDEKGVQQPEDDGTGNAGKATEGKAAQGEEESPGPTGIRNADVEEERGESVERTKKTKQQIDAEGKRLVDSGEVDPDELAKSIIEKPRPASAEEQAALLYHKTKLKNANRELAKDPTPENQFQFAQNEDLLEQNRKATEVIGNELGRGLGTRTDQMAEDYSRINILNRAKIANGGELDPKDEAELITRTKRIEDLESKLAEREEQIRKLQENSLVDKVKNAASLEERQAKREVTKAGLRKEREGLLAELHVIARKSLKTTGANKIPVDMIVPLTKLARNYVLDGITTLSGVADKIYNDLKEHVDGLKKDDIEDVLKNEFPKYLDEQNKVRLARAKKLQQTKLETLKEQQESGNFEKKVIRKIQVDNDYLNIRAEINREQQKINKKIADIENSKKSVNRKIVDIAVKYGRQAKLASVSVLGKLAATGLATIGLKPVTEGVGKVVSKILPKTAERSSVEGSVSRSALKEANKVTEGAAVGSLAQAYSRAFTIGMKDAYQELIGAGSNLSNLYKERGATLPSEAKEFFGHLHSAIKAPVKRFAWEQSYAKRVAKNIQAGLDPMDPIRDAKNRLDAYKDGEKTIFMGDNELSVRYENAVGAMERGKSSLVRTIAAGFRILLPFVKVPSNIVLEGAKYSFGSISGVARLGRALTKGMDNLTPEEADTILEHLKKGSIGGAAMLIGFYNPKAFGGFYQPGKKEKVAAGHIKVNGVDIPAILVEHPIFIAAQVGANFRQLLDKYRHVDNRITIATTATLSGLGYEVPQANEIKRLVDLTGNVKSTKNLEKFLAQTVRGEIEPAAIQQLAQITDVKQGANTFIPGAAFTDKTQQKRKPNERKGMMRYIWDDLKTGVPGARETVRKKND
jgi:hypothetical protein